MSVEWEHQRQAGRSCLYHKSHGVKQGGQVCEKQRNPAERSQKESTSNEAW